MYVAVVGPGSASAEDCGLAEKVGAGLARAGVTVVTGGLGGVMEAASKGASEAGGVVVALLPGADRAAASPSATVALPTGLGELRNGLIVRAADVVVAVGGGYGTLSEVALALRSGVAVIGLGTWAIEGVVAVASADDAVAEALRRLDAWPPSSPPT